MPSAARRKKAAANTSAAPTSTTPTPPLEGCCIAFSGTFPARTQASLMELATRLGADTSKSVAGEVTHLVTSQADYDKPSMKVTQANARDAFIVTLQWMLQSEQDGVKPQESEYALTGRSFSASPTLDPPNNTSKKRRAPDTTSFDPNNSQASDSSAPEPKKTKLLASDSKAPAMGKSQVAKDWSIQVPVDEGCTLAGYGVHVDDDSIIWDASLNQTNAKDNANKFYRIQVLVGPSNDCKTWTRWGRVGEIGKSMVLGDGSLANAKMHFEKKFKDKSGLRWDERMESPKPGKYVFIERSYEPDSDDDDNPPKSRADERKPPPCTLDPAVQGLMQLIFNQQFFAATMSDMNYDDKKMPLGKLSQATILRGFGVLKSLSTIIENPGAAPASPSVDSLSDMFYSIIPHVFGNRTVRPPVINNMAMVKQEIELLETLADMKNASDIMKPEIDELNRLHPLDRQFRGLHMDEMTPLDPKGNEYQLLQSYLNTTRGQTHVANYNVETIFRIERHGEQGRFDDSVFAGPAQDRRLLWHGSRATNFGGILSQGLRIAPPEAPASGYMFGKGVYLADMSSKSANYCRAHISGGTALLLLCEAELGKPMRELTMHDYHAAENAKADGCWSTFGKGQTGPSLWTDASCLHPSLKGVKMPATARSPPGPTGLSSHLLYNEYICYDESQIRLRYLFRVKM